MRRLCGRRVPPPHRVARVQGVVDTSSAVRKSEAVAPGMLEARLAMTIPEDWRTSVARAYDAVIEIMRCWKGRDGWCVTHVEVRVDPAHIGPALDLIRGHPTVHDSALRDMGQGRLRGTVTTRTCARCHETGSRAFVVEARIGPDGRLVQRLLVEDREALRAIVARLERDRLRPELLGVSTMDAWGMLTPRQEEIIQLAYDRGYYNAPKDIGLREIAGIFDISASTVSEILRKSERRIMERFFA